MKETNDNMIDQMVEYFTKLLFKEFGDEEGNEVSL